MGAHSGSEVTRPVGQPHLGPGVESGAPGAVGDAGREHELLAAGTHWARSDGWYVSEGTGTLELRPGTGGGPRGGGLPGGGGGGVYRWGGVGGVVGGGGGGFLGGGFGWFGGGGGWGGGGGRG